MNRQPAGSSGVDVAAASRAALAALEGGEPVAAVLVIGGPEPALGRRMLVWAGRQAGSLGPKVVDERAAAIARELLGAAGPTAAEHEVEAEDGTWSVYVEVFRPPPRLVIVGAGHIARPLCRLGAMLGFDVIVLDDRPEFATRERFPEAREVRRADFTDPFRGIQLDAGSHLVLVTRGHKYDFDALRLLLREPVEPAYIGMVGSRRRVRAALGQLAREGIAIERLARIHAPIGLDIGAETPEEIAVAIAAEIVRVRRGGSGASLRDRDRVVERWLSRERRDAGDA